MITFQELAEQVIQTLMQEDGFSYVKAVYYTTQNLIEQGLSDELAIKIVEQVMNG